jgi:hypothetical protein
VLYLLLSNYLEVAPLCARRAVQGGFRGGGRPLTPFGPGAASASASASFGHRTKTVRNKELFAVVQGSTGGPTTSKGVVGRLRRKRDREGEERALRAGVVGVGGEVALSLSPPASSARARPTTPPLPHRPREFLFTPTQHLSLGSLLLLLDCRARAIAFDRRRRALASTSRPSPSPPLPLSFLPPARALSRIPRATVHPSAPGSAPRGP